MISAINSQGKVRFMIYQDTMNQQRLIRFMERLIRVSKQKVSLIPDNLKVHHGKFAASWLEKHKALQYNLEHGGVTMTDIQRTRKEGKRKS